jgi:histidine triad (HIT) family protein
MDDCVFCKIVSGQIPCYKVYEDDLFLGFLDIKPLNPGNSLLIPKIHYRWVYDVPEFGQYWEIAKKIALITMPIVGASATSFLTLGYEVTHAHIRIIPRFDNDSHTHGIDTLAIVSQTPQDLTRIASEMLSLIK